MAKKKYKKYKQKYTTSDRLDMSKGGRVNYQVGGLNKRDERFDPRDDFISIGGPGGGITPPKEDPPIQVPPIDPPKEDPVVTPPGEKGPSFKETSMSSREMAEAAARGEVPEAAVIKPISITGGTKLLTGKDQQTTTMDPITKGQTFQAQDQAPETVATSQAAQVDETIGQDIQAGKVTDVATVADKDVEVKAADGTVTQGPIGDIQ